MENLSSSELDSPSKTPLFIAIAAVIVALVALGLGWMSFSRAETLQKELARLEALASADNGLEQAVKDNAERVEKVASNMTQLSKNISDALGEVSSDITKVRSDIRKVAIDAGTAKKMVEELEEKGVQVAVVPASKSSSAGTASTGDEAAVKKAPDAAPGKAGVYTIKSGDTLGRIAAAYKISLSELLSANPGVDPRRLRIGQQITIPAPSN